MPSCVSAECSIPWLETIKSPNLPEYPFPLSFHPGWRKRLPMADRFPGLSKKVKSVFPMNMTTALVSSFVPSQRTQFDGLAFQSTARSLPLLPTTVLLNFPPRVLSAAHSEQDFSTLLLPMEEAHSLVYNSLPRPPLLRISSFEKMLIFLSKLLIIR